MKKFTLFVCMASAMLLLTSSFAFAKDHPQVKYNFAFVSCIEPGRPSVVAIGISGERFTKDPEYPKWRQSGLWKEIGKVAGVHAVQSITPGEVVFLADYTARRIDVLNSVVDAIGKKKKWAMYAESNIPIDYCQKTQAANTSSATPTLKPANSTPMPTPKPEGGSQKTFQFTKELFLGVTDPEVLVWQKYLAAQGLFNLELLENSTPNYFGPATKKATEDFQEKFKEDGNLLVTGRLDAVTKDYVNKLLRAQPPKPKN